MVAQYNASVRGRRRKGRKETRRCKGLDVVVSLHVAGSRESEMDSLGDFCRSVGDGQSDGGEESQKRGQASR